MNGPPGNDPDRPRSPLVLVAMSGGVDSAVAAALLKENGYPTLGVTMKLWDYAEVGGRPGGAEGRCCSLETVDGARSSAALLGIPFYVMDMTGPFRSSVIADFVAEYRAGRTPNPCVVCNNSIKWEALFRRAQQVGAERIATGHYARVRYNDRTGRHELLKGLDASRDQSYVLYGLNQQQLARTLFPLGTWTKRRVRAHARALGLPVADREESREICFITDDNYRRFLRERLAANDAALEPGPVVNERGETVGRHPGYANYTVGQRRGLNLALGRPYYVRRIDPATRAVHIAPDPLLYAEEAVVAGVNWVSRPEPADPIAATVRIRYQHPGAPALLVPEGPDRVRIRFASAQRALTPGQSAVFYDGELVLGGGLVER